VKTRYCHLDTAKKNK